MTANSKPIYRSKLERQQAVQQHIFQAPSHDGHKRGRDEDDGVVRANKKQLLKREQKLLEDAIKEHLRCYQQPSKRPVIKKLRFSWDNNEDTTRLYDPSSPLFCLRFRANANNKDDMDKPPKNQNQNQNEKNRHWSDKNIDDMTDRDWHIFMEDFKISYKCKCKARSRIPRPQPLRSWAESMLCTQLLRAVEKAGYKTPSPIQMATIPLGLQQCDVIGIAETGSGKTAAFLLPLLSYVSKLPPITVDSEADGPYALVMAPTRELALQIQDETVKFARYLGGIRVVSIVGGQSIQEQAFKLRQGCEVVIATPGRLIDCLERRYVVLNQCNYVVLDEADRMIDMGFEPQVVRVLDAMPCSNLKPENEDEELDEKRFYRTTHMFTATMPPAVERLARKYLRNPVVITIGTAGKTSDLITQHVIVVQESEKMPRLQKMLNRLGEKSAILFVNNRMSADTLSKALDKAGYRVTTLHGGKSQNQREISLEGFRSKRFTLLVATDVMGRGIDIPEVAHVINYDMPGSIETYTHRIGRTGRAGKTGVATTFLTLHDTQVFYDLKQMLIQSNNPVPPELARHEMSKFKPCHFA